MIYNAYCDSDINIDGVSLVSCGHIFAQSGREINRPTGRDDWLLFYVAGESETFYFDKAVNAARGSFVIFAPGQKQHHIYEGNKTAEFYYVHFKCEHPPFSLKTSTVYDLPFQRRICDEFEGIIDELQKKQPHYARLALCKLLGLFCFIERQVSFTSSKTGGQFERIALAVSQMNRFYANDVSLDDYAKMCNMSKYHFLRTFEKAVGQTPLCYRNNIRLEHAAELLRDGGMSASEVSETVGFSSSSYFCQAFKQKYGVSPKNYK